MSRRINGVTMPLSRKRMKWHRNWLCLCGSGEKYKKCCMKEIEMLGGKDGNVVEQKLSPDVQELVDKYQKALEDRSNNCD